MGERSLELHPVADTIDTMEPPKTMPVKPGRSLTLLVHCQAAIQAYFLGQGFQFQ